MIFCFNRIHCCAVTVSSEMLRCFFLDCYVGSVQFELWWAEVTAFTTKTAKGGPKVDVLKQPVLAGDVDLSRLQAQRHGPVLLKLLENDPVFPIDDKVKKHMKARDKGIAFPCIFVLFTVVCTVQFLICLSQCIGTGYTHSLAYYLLFATRIQGEFDNG